MTVPAPVLVLVESVRIRWCVLCLGASILCTWPAYPAMAEYGGPQIASADSSPHPGEAAGLDPGALDDSGLPSSGTAGVDSRLSSVLLQRGDLTLRDTSLSDALFTISSIWKVNLVVGQDVEGEVNGSFRDAPLYEILDSILLSNGYGYRPVGHSLAIMPLKELGDWNPMFQSATIVLKNISPNDILKGVSLLASPQGKVEAVPPANSLMVVDFPDRVATIRRVVAEWDRAASRPDFGAAGGQNMGLQVVSFSPQFVAAASLQPAVETIISKTGQSGQVVPGGPTASGPSRGQSGKVAVMEPDNKLIVSGSPQQIELARQLVRQLDVPRQQIRITAMIYDLSVKDIERLGINWTHALKDRHDAEGNAQSVWNINSVVSVPVSSGLANGTMTFMNLSRHFDITAVVQALQEAKDSRLLSNPNVTVLDHEKALMSVLTEVPYQELTETSQGGNIGTTSFREAGIKLEVTPHIAENGTIRMEVNPSFSRLTGYTPGSQPMPIIDRREAKTTVGVLDRQVLVIGGLRQRNDTGNFHGIPYLKDIKKFNMGALFRGRDTEVRESELVVFIMPEIVPYDHSGAGREGVAFQTGQCLLDEIPMASGGHPPRRPEPCHPPTPMGGPRIHGTPYQPNTCPPPCNTPTTRENMHGQPPTWPGSPPRETTSVSRHRPHATASMGNAREANGPTQISHAITTTPQPLNASSGLRRLPAVKPVLPRFVNTPHPTSQSR